MVETKEKADTQDWEIQEYEDLLETIEILENKIANPEMDRLLSVHRNLENQLKELKSDPKFGAYRFLRAFALSDEFVIFCRGTRTKKYAIYLGEKSEAGYPRLLFFDHKESPVHLPCLLITSGEPFEEIPVAKFIHRVVALF